MDMEVYAKLVDAGVDDLLAKHYAHLFIRDPLVVFRELLDQDDQTSSDHFENIQSTNWQSMRFKPPPPSAPNMGWRVEFRSMEIQLTDHENAVFSIFVVLLTRTILAYNLNFYIPLSKVDENMQTAQKRDAVLNETFWFRRDIFGEIYSTCLLDCQKLTTNIIYATVLLIYIQQQTRLTRPARVDLFFPTHSTLHPVYLSIH